MRDRLSQRSRIRRLLPMAGVAGAMVAGILSAGVGTASAATITPGVFTPLANPARACDTRAAAGTFLCTPGAVSGGGTVNVPPSNVPANATAVVVNVAATNAAGQGFLSAYPTGTTPAAPTSVVNYTNGQNVSNQATVQLGTVTPTGGTATPSITIANGPSTTGTVDVVVDVQGYYAPPASTTSNAGEYTALTPARIGDTRCFPSSQSFCSAENIPVANQGTSTLTAAGTQNIQVIGVGGVPTAGVSAVVLNVAEVNATAASFFTIYPAGQTQPVVANLNFAAGEVLSGKVIVPVGANGDVTIFNHAGTSDAVVDVEGYFSNSTGVFGSLFTPVAPTRIIGTTASGTTVAAGASIVTPVIGTNGIPAGATAVALNLADVQPAKGNFLTAYPSDQHAPVASDVNFIPANTYNVVTNAAYATLSTTAGSAATIGSFSVLNGPANTNNNAGSTSVDADLFGYFTPTTQTGVLVTATPSTLAANGTSTSTISATVHNGAGQIVAGDAVLFTAPTGCGVLSGASPATNSSGVATATLTAPTFVAGTTPANCTITVQEADNGLVGSTNVALTEPANTFATFTATPSTVPANGSSTSALSATVANGGTVGSNFNDVVTFTTSGAACGTISAPSGTTGAAGSTPVTATYTASTTPGFCTVTASEANSKATMSVVIDQTTAPAPAAGTLTITPLTAALTANGTATQTFTLTAKDATTAVIPNDSVALTTAPVPAGACGTLSAAMVTTNASGIATVTYTSSTVAGTCTISATEADTGATVTAPAVVTQSAPASATTVTTSNAGNLVPIGTTTTVTAAVSNIPTGVTGSVVFTTTGGAACGTYPSGTGTSAAVPLVAGSASTTYTASSTTGFCTVTATTTLSVGTATPGSTVIDQT